MNILGLSWNTDPSASNCLLRLSPHHQADREFLWSHHQGAAGKKLLYIFLGALIRVTGSYTTASLRAPVVKISFEEKNQES